MITLQAYDHNESEKQWIKLSVVRIIACGLLLALSFFVSVKVSVWYGIVLAVLSLFVSFVVRSAALFTVTAILFAVLIASLIVPSLEPLRELLAATAFLSFVASLTTLMLEVKHTSQTTVSDRKKGLKDLFRS